jgi:myo-inositol-1(or 4)-monophosphatase
VTTWCDGRVSTLPPSTPETFAELERFAVELAMGASEVIRHHSHAQLSVTTKTTSTDLVTDVDRRSETWLTEQIAATRPDDAILGEEGADRPGSSGVRWVLDPIDGTVNFVLGLPFYAVSVAADVDGTVVAGAVSNPVSGEVFRASLGGGAWLGQQRLAGPRIVPMSRAVVGTGFNYERGRRARQVAVVAELLPQVADIRRLGAASLDLCAVAAGRLDAYFEAGLNSWDYSAGVLIAAEAGCLATGLRERPPSSQFTAVAGVSLAQELFALLEDLGADAVSS